MKLISMLDNELVLDKVPGSSRQEIYSAMLRHLNEYAELELDVDKVTESMISHEDAAGELFPLLAMPHIRCNKLHDMFIVVGLPENPDAFDGKRAELVFMTLIGETMSDLYLKVISTLAHHLMDPAAAANLMSAARGGVDTLWKYLENSDIKLRNVVTAEDVMSPVKNCLKLDNLLSDAFDMFYSSGHRFLPVVDNNGKLVGELSALDVIKKFIPEYVFMMDNANFVNDFSVFNKIFEIEHSQPLAQFMNQKPAQASLDTPLFQLTLQLVKAVGNVYIVDNDNTLQGVFAINNVISKVLRG